jgi:hypothetical protein
MERGGDGSARDPSKPTLADAGIDKDVTNRARRNRRSTDGRDRTGIAPARRPPRVAREVERGGENDSLAGVRRIRQAGELGVGSVRAGASALGSASRDGERRLKIARPKKSGGA